MRKTFPAALTVDRTAVTAAPGLAHAAAPDAPPRWGGVPCGVDRAGPVVRHPRHAARLTQAGRQEDSDRDLAPAERETRTAPGRAADQPRRTRLRRPGLSGSPGCRRTTGECSGQLRHHRLRPAGRGPQDPCHMRPDAQSEVAGQPAPVRAHGIRCRRAIPSWDPLVGPSDVPRPESALST